RSHGNTQPRGSLGNSWVTDRRNEKSFVLQRGRQVNRGLLVANNPGKNRTGGMSGIFSQSGDCSRIAGKKFLHQTDSFPKQKSAAIWADHTDLVSFIEH